LGFSLVTSTSKTPFVTKDKITYVPSTCVKTKGKGVHDFTGCKPESVHPSKKQPYQRFLLRFLIGLFGPPTNVFVICGLVDLHLGFGQKEVQENQVHKASFAGSSIDVRMKWVDKKPRLLMSRRNVSSAGMFSHVQTTWRNIKFHLMGSLHMSRRV
jgi:hypothetical protein